MKNETYFHKEKSCTLEEVIRLERRIKKIAYKSPLRYKNITLQPYLRLQKNMYNMKDLTPTAKMKILLRFLKMNPIFKHLGGKLK